MAGFTPGPWGYAIDDKDIYVGVMPMARRYDAVALVDYDDVDQNEAKANARLIAAAPELYEVVRQVVEAAELAGLNGPLSQQAKSALAKARGES